MSHTLIMITAKMTPIDLILNKIEEEIATYKEAMLINKVTKKEETGLKSILTLGALHLDLKDLSMEELMTRVDKLENLGSIAQKLDIQN